MRRRSTRIVVLASDGSCSASSGSSYCEFIFVDEVLVSSWFFFKEGKRSYRQNYDRRNKEYRDIIQNVNNLTCFIKWFSCISIVVYIETLCCKFILHLDGRMMAIFTEKHMLVSP
jgi:hypothetical protein